MSYFNTKQEAIKWADSYGYNYAYKVEARGNLWLVVWGYREPYGV